MATNLTRELDVVHRDCRTLQRTWLSKQSELVTAQVWLCAVVLAPRELRVGSGVSQALLRPGQVWH